MAKKSAKNSELLKNLKLETSPRIYSILVDLVRDDREKLVDEVLKIDYLLEYSSTCIKQRDIKEARDTLEKAKNRIDMLASEGVDTEYLNYLFEGIEKKTKKQNKKPKLY